MNCCKHKYFVIFRGDDTDFPGNQELVIEIDTTRDLTGCSAHFSFQGFVQDFAEIPADRKLRLVIPNSETGKFALGAADARLWLTNGQKIRTVENKIHIVVTNRVEEAYDNDDPQAITVTISGGGGGSTVVLDDTVTAESQNGVKSSGIWSWVKSLLPRWLTSDYAEPATVASVEAKADKSALDAHVADIDNPHGVTAEQVDAYTKAETDDKLAEKANRPVGFDSSHAGNLAALTADGNLADSGIDTTNGLTVPDGDIQATNGGVYGISYLATGGDINASGNIFTDNSGEIEIRDGEGDVLHSLSSKAARASLAPEYSPTSAYAVGAIVYHDGNIYQCKTAIADGGEAWNAEHWELRKLDDFFTNSNSLLTGTIAANSARLALDEDGEIIVTMNTED